VRLKFAAPCAALLAASTHAAPPEFAASVSTSQPILWYRLAEPSGQFANSGTLGAAFNAVATGSPSRAVPTASGDAGVGLAQGAFLESLGASPLTGNPTFSIEAVIRLASPGAASLWGPFLHWGDGGANRNGKEVYFSVSGGDNSRVYAGFYNGGLRTPYQLDPNTWMHVVWTRQGGTDSEAGSKLYINGCLIATQRDPELLPGFLSAANINVNSTSFRINEARDVLGARFFTGTLDEIALYDRILTADEIAFRGSLYKCPADQNCDAVVDLSDFFEFFNCFDLTLPCADLDGNNEVDLGDFFLFFNGFDNQC
jgi:hypothetical protein